MDLHRAIDIYCERTDASFWAEPVNALTNAAFLVAAALAWRRWRAAGGRDWPALALICLVATIGVGSFLFHTFATTWALLADVIPIQVFMLAMFGVMLKRLAGWPAWAAVLGAGGFLAAGLGAPRLADLLLQHREAGALFGYGVGLLAMLVLGGAGLRMADSARRRAGQLILSAAAVFTASLTFRTIDGDVCSLLPLGTHFLWHILNAVTLALLLFAAIDLGRASAARQSSPARSAP
jgi:hypothetical protein